jgi:serine/threonine protein kinase
MPTDPARVETLFNGALARPPAERPAFLAAECGGDAELRARVERLLAAHDELDAPAGTGDFEPDGSTRTFGDAPAATGTYHADATAGTVVAGKYTLTEAIGEGGMGSVWRAKQTEPVKRFVAVKLIKAGMDSKQVLARFEAERQALAVMDHPNIAKVLDGGLHDGRPFFVMELVKGVPSTDYCDAAKLTPTARLELFVQACQAIQHAHQKGIIHRDIKPSNVLVALYDERPVVKVIDFGVAKATGGTLTEHTIDTGFGGVVGTPQYMSPEQTTFNNLDIDTRSDVYALGVLLYELLTGSPPFSRKELEKKGLLEILRVVREEEPPRPSTKLSTADALPSLSANRGTEPKKLTGLLRNELDWIVMKALEKDRARRYETANGFAADVQRYLSGEAVIAHPPSTAYRLRKFVRRNKGQVIAASLVLFALLAGVVGTSLGLREAQAQRDFAREQETEAKKQEAEAVRQAGLANEERAKALDAAGKEKQAKELADAKRQEAEQQQQRAEAGEKLAGERLTQVQAEKKRVEAEKQRADVETQVAQAVIEFLQKKLLAQASTAAQADALMRAGGSSAEAKLNPTIRELLDRAAKELTPDKIEANFPKQPLVQASILRTVGDAYQGIGEAAIGLRFLTRSVELFKSKLGPGHPATLASMSQLGWAYRAAGQLDKALPLLEESLKLMKDNLGPDHPNALNNMGRLALGYEAAGKLDLALPLFEEALKLTKAKLGPDHPDTLASMNNLASGYGATGKFDLALPLWEETLKLTKAKLGPDHPDTLITMSNLAWGYRIAGKLDLALPLSEETLKLQKAKVGPDHPDTLATMNNLAEGYRAASKLDLALPLYEEALKLTKAKLDPDHPDTLKCRNNLALGYLAAGKLDLALPLFEEALKLQKAQLGPDHPDTLHTMAGLAACYWSLRRLDQSVPLFEELLPIREKKLGRTHPNTLMAVANLGVNYKDAGRLKEAIPLLEEAHAASKTHAHLRFVGLPLLDAYAKAGKSAEAKTLIDELLADARKSLPKDSPPLAGRLAQFGMTLLEAKGYAEAEPLLRESLAIREKTQPDAWTTFNTQSMLGGAILGQKKYGDAEPLLVKGYEGLKAREKSMPQGSTRIPEALDRLIDLYTATNKPDEAQKYRALRAAYPNVAPPPRELKR